MRELSTKHPHLFMYKRAQKRNQAAYDRYLSQFDDIQDELKEDEAIFIDEQLSMEQKEEIMNVPIIKNKYSSTKAVAYGLLFAVVLILIILSSGCMAPEETPVRAIGDPIPAPKPTTSPSLTPYGAASHYVYDDTRQFSDVDYFANGMHYKIFRSTNGGLAIINLTLDSAELKYYTRN